MTGARLRRASPAAFALVAAAALSLAVTISSDGRYALAWGATLARGEVPDLGPGDLPTPHPGPIALGVLLAGLGPTRAADALAAVAAGALVLLLFASLRLGREIGGTAVGFVALALVATQSRVWFFGLHAFVDVPFAALVLLATARAASQRSGRSTSDARDGRDRRRRDRVVLIYLGVAGLLRPEAWPLALGYAGWAATRARRAHPPEAGKAAPADLPVSRRAAVPLVALALAAPVLWLGLDLLLTGDPLHSLTATRALAADLARPRGADDLLPALVGGLNGLVGWPVACAGVVLGGWSVARAHRRGLAAPARSVALVLALATAGLAAMGAMAVAGLPLNDRYLLVPALALAVLAATGFAARAIVPRAALALALAGTTVAAALDPFAVPREVALAQSKRATDGALDRALSSRAVRARLAPCRLVGAEGPARAQVSALLARDPAAVPIVPRSGPTPVPAPDCVVRAPVRSDRGGRVPVLSVRSPAAEGGRGRPAPVAARGAPPAR